MGIKSRGSRESHHSLHLKLKVLLRGGGVFPALKGRGGFPHLMGCMFQNVGATTSAEAPECGRSWKEMFRFAECEAIVAGNQRARKKECSKHLNGCKNSREETEFGETC